MSTVYYSICFFRLFILFFLFFSFLQALKDAIEAFVAAKAAAAAAVPAPVTSPAPAPVPSPAPALAPGAAPGAEHYPTPTAQPTPPQPASPSAAPLPPGFTCVTDAASGRLVFINHANRTTSWHDPRMAAAAPPVQAPAVAHIPTPTPAAQPRPAKPPVVPPAAAVIAVAPAGPCTWESFDVNTGVWTQLQPDSETVVEAAFRLQQPSATVGGGGGGGQRNFEVEGDEGWFPLDAKTNSDIVQCLASRQRVLQTGFNRQIDTVAWTQTRTDTGKVRIVREIVDPSIVFDLNAGTLHNQSTNVAQRIQRVARPMIYEFHEAERARWVRFLPHAEAIIEAAREKDLAAQLQVNVVPSGRPVMYLIDLGKLEQQNCRTGFCRTIRRRINDSP